jgi:hypothetical protein
MEKHVNRFTDIILTVFMEFVEARKNSVEGLQYEIVADNTNLRYQLVLLGWRGKERIYHVLFHVDIINDKIWIQEDNTEIGLANLLTEKGLVKQEIVLAYFSEFHRQFTDYAAA